MDYKKLQKDMEQAMVEALKYKDTHDGGTCNFDTPVLILKGVRESKMKELFGEKYGCYKWDNGHYHIGSKILCGQANRRTKMAEIFATSLERNGWNTTVYYQMD